MKMPSKRIFLITWSLLLFCGLNKANAQYFDVREGNQAYEAENYKEAEDSYNRVLNTDESISDKKEALFNKGNALFRQENYEEAQKVYEQLALNEELDTRLRSEAYYNTANSITKEADKLQNPGERIPKLEQALNNYKSALKLNPSDIDAKQNFEIVKNEINKLKQQQQEQKDKDKDKKEQKKEEKKEKEEEQQEQEPQNKQENQEQKQQQKPQQQEQQNFSKEQAERILNALKQDEQQMLKKYQQKPASSQKFDKDW